MTNRTVPASTPATAIGARLHAALPVERWGATGFPGRWVGGAAIVLGPPLMTPAHCCASASPSSTPTNSPRTNGTPP